MIEIIPNWHPLLVHFTVGLLSTSVLFYLASAVLSHTNSWKQQWLNWPTGRYGVVAYLL
jgi:uncharacterized membrane protein